MNKTYLIAMAAALLAAPLAYGSAPVTTCETTSSTHHYSGGNGLQLRGFLDGSLQDCDGDFDPFHIECIPEGVVRQDINGDGLLCEAFDYDGHHEYAVGGAWLLADDGDLFNSGAYVCFGENAHHPRFGPFTVHDDILGFGAAFAVGADYYSNIFGLAVRDSDPWPGVQRQRWADCGDGEIDAWAECVGWCSVTFAPGIDGAYQVFVTGTGGTVTA